MILPVLLASALIIVVLAAAGQIYARLGESSDKHRFPPPGRLLTVEGCRMHIHEQGKGSPAVVLEAGIAASSLSWSHVQPLVAKFTRVVSYDRPGLGWSEYCKQPRTLERMSAELSALLDHAGVSPPYILVGHSFGGLLMRYFAHSNPLAREDLCSSIRCRSKLGRIARKRIAGDSLAV